MHVREACLWCGVGSTFLIRRVAIPSPPPSLPAQQPSFDFVVQHQVRQVDDTAEWRNGILSHDAVIQRMIMQGKTVNPLLQAPFVHKGLFRIDWLHVADQGLGADWLGCFIKYVADQDLGANKQERYQHVFDDIDQWYKENEVEDRLDGLVPTLVESSKKTGYKLRCSAATARALIPWTYTCAMQLLDPSDDVEATLQSAAWHIKQAYEALSNECKEPHLQMKYHGQQFAIQWVALHDCLNEDNHHYFRIKPKLHLWLHLCEEGSTPRRTWTYRDEDFGGTISHVARRRGGFLNAKATSEQVQMHFKTHTPAVRIV